MTFTIDLRVIVRLLSLLKGRFRPKREVVTDTRANFLFDDAALSLPQYLSSEQKGKLFAGLKDFPDNMEYFAKAPDDDPLQGDGWSEIQVFILEKNATQNVNVILLSNSCDLSQANTRQLPMRVMVAPIFRLSKIEASLSSQGAKKEVITGLFDSFRSQAVSNAFYLPECKGLPEESIVFLDNISSHLLDDFYSYKGKSRLFSLSQQGAYLLSLKLSIHFCRLTDGVVR